MEWKNILKLFFFIPFHSILFYSLIPNESLVKNSLILISFPPIPSNFGENENLRFTLRLGVHKGREWKGMK